MSIPVPPSKPRATREVVLAAASKAWRSVPASIPLPDRFVLGVRGYYRDSMGAAGKNDYGMNDDAFFIVTPDSMTAWNGNTDPSRIGWNAGAGKYMARLKPGCWKFRRLKHKASSPNGYMAWGQGDMLVTVERIRQDGTVAQVESGCFGINLHRGGDPGTSSEGCQTIYLPQWKLFDTVMLATFGKEWFDYILVEGPLV